MEIKQLQLTRNIKYSTDYKCLNYNCNRENTEKTLIGWSKDHDGFVVIYECNKCESQFYFHPIIERDNFEKFIKSITEKRDIKYDLPSYYIEKDIVMEEFHKFRKILCSTKYFYSEKYFAYEEFLKKYWLHCDPETFKHLSNVMGPGAGSEIAIRLKYEKITEQDLINLLNKKVIHKKSDFI